MVYTTHKNWQIEDGLLLLYPHDRYIAPPKKIPKSCKPVIIQTMGEMYIIELLNYHPGNVSFYLLGGFYIYIYNHVEVDTVPYGMFEHILVLAGIGLIYYFRIPIYLI